MSYFAAGLMPAETIKIAERYVGTKDWEKTRDLILKENILQTRVSATLKRQSQELLKRLKSLTDGQIEILLQSDAKDQRLIFENSWDFTKHPLLECGGVYAKISDRKISRKVPKNLNQMG